MKKVSIVIPAYNEEKRIGNTLDKYCQCFDNIMEHKKLSDYQILVVINGTTDGTENVVREHMKKTKKINFLNFKQGGKGFAISEGFRDSLKKNFDLIGFVDADMATSPEEYWKLIEKIGDYDGSIADRYIKGAKIVPSFSFRRIIVSRVFNLIVRGLFGLRYKDTQCGAKIFKKEAIDKTLGDLVITQWAYDVNLLYSCKKNNMKIISVPTVWFEAEGSNLKINKASIQMFFAVFQLRIAKSPFKRFLKILKPLLDKIYEVVK